MAHTWSHFPLMQMSFVMQSDWRRFHESVSAGNFSGKNSVFVAILLPHRHHKGDMRQPDVALEKNCYKMLDTIEIIKNYVCKVKKTSVKFENNS
jgi:hypothetical protein